MSNTISINYMSSMTNRYMNMVSRKASDQTSTGTMSDAIAKACAGKTADVERAASAAPVSKEDMTMEEYKQYISDQISGFRIDPSRSRDQYSINISDAGFEAMKNDPEYEEWVLDYIKRDMAVAAPGWYTAMGGEPAYCMLNFGATKEERTGQMISMNYKNGQGKGIFDTHSNNSFWTNRADKQKQIAVQTQKKAAARKRQEKALAEKATRDRFHHQQIMQEFLSTRFFSSQETIASGVTDTASLV